MHSVPVGNMAFHAALFVEQVEALQWTSGKPPAELAREGSMRLRVKTRHGPQMRDCSLRLVLPPLQPPLEVNQASTGGFSEDGGRALANDQKPSTATATRGYVNLDAQESALAPGQFAAFYLRDECVGSGVIGGWSAAAATAAVGAVPEREGATGTGIDLGTTKPKLERKKRGAATAVGR